MNYLPTPLSGVILIAPLPITDERGFFARTVCADEFARQGINAGIVQQSISFNHHRGTLRGMHYQAEPYAEEKLVRVTSGAIFDVVADLRSDSPTFRQWHGVELSAGNRHAIYIPRGVAHGFLTLVSNTEILYQMTVPHHPECACGIRWNDPALGIIWPFEPVLISPRDNGYPYLVFNK